MGGETKTGVALFVPKLAFTGESSTLRTYRISLTALTLFSRPLASNRCKVNENRTPCYVKSIFHGRQAFSRLIVFLRTIIGHQKRRHDKHHEGVYEK